MWESLWLLADSFVWMTDLNGRLRGFMVLTWIIVGVFYRMKWQVFTVVGMFLLVLEGILTLLGSLASE